MDQDKTRMAFADGGIPIDPVSGNEVPPGSLPEEVRDDIPAQLSEGEYIVPADVLRYFGMKFFEDLRAEAKAALGGMEQDGRMGGEPMMEEPMGAEDDLPFLTEELLATDDMNEGGYMRGYAKGGITTPDQAAAAYPNTQMADIFGIGGNTGGIQYVTYYGPNGDAVTIQTFNGIPMSPVPSGYTTTPPVAAAKDVAPKTRGESDNNEKDQGQPNTSFDGMTADERAARMGQVGGITDKIGLGIASTIGGVFGGPIGAYAAKEFMKAEQMKQNEKLAGMVQNDYANIAADNFTARAYTQKQLDKGFARLDKDYNAFSPVQSALTAGKISSDRAADRNNADIGTKNSVSSVQASIAANKNKSTEQRSADKASFDKANASYGKSLGANVDSKGSVGSAKGDAESAANAKEVGEATGTGNYGGRGGRAKGGLMTKKK